MFAAALRRASAERSAHSRRLQPHSRRTYFASRGRPAAPGHHQRRRCSRQCSQTSAVPASSLAARCRRRSAAAAVSLRNCGGNSRSTVRAHQQPVQRAAMPPPASRACAALLHIALLCRADRFSPSTLSVTMRRVLCAVCPMLRHRQCGCITLRVQFASAYRKRRGGSKRRQTSTSFWRGLYFTVQNAVPALLCGCARAQHE